MSEPALRSAPEPIDEPLVVTVWEQTIIVAPGTEAWPIAWAWREMKAHIENIEADLRSKRALIRKLQDDQDAKRKAYGNRALIEAVFERWRTRSGHKGAKLTPERFDATRCRLEEGYEGVHLHMAVEGLIAAAVVKDGKRYDDYDVCMRKGSQVERYANLAPPEIRRELVTQPLEQMAMEAGS